MKTIANKIINIFFALLIPVSFLAGCQEDLTDPQSSSLPPKNEIKKPPGSE